MGGVPVVISTTFGVPVTNIGLPAYPSKLQAEPMTPVTHGFGEPVVLVSSGGTPVSLINDDGTAWVAP